MTSERSVPAVVAAIMNAPTKSDTVMGTLGPLRSAAHPLMPEQEAEST